VGAKWEATGNEQVYFNIQKNQRQYQAYGGGGSADPWSTSSQAAFDYIKAHGQPESSWTYEVGLRSHHNFTGSLLTGLEAQINYYHVDFSNRLLAVSAAAGGIAGGSISGGTTSLFNVGSVTTNGVDAAVTLHFTRISRSITRSATIPRSTAATIPPPPAAPPAPRSAAPAW
jgi:outer membrane receptor for ferrienterochelin and colicin